MHTSLNDIPRRNAFVVPDGYFKELPTAVLIKSSDSKVRQQFFLASAHLWWGVAACVTLLLGIWFVVPNTTLPSDSLISKESSLTNDADFYLQDYLVSCIPSSMIEDVAESEDIDFSGFYDEISSGELSDEELLSYINYADLYYQ